MTHDFQVHLIAKTMFWVPDDVPDDLDWESDAEGGQALVEFAGRACYQSWDKPNPATATNQTYLRHILEVGHLSVLEHGTVTFYFTGVSRSFTHELIRHRHFSYSQLSQRYAAPDGEVVEPELIASDEAASKIFWEAVSHTETAYHQLSQRLNEVVLERGQFPLSTTGRRKAVRQAARSVLPNATETKIVVTGNYRAWRHFIAMRATVHADVEICAVAVEVLRQLQRVAPNVFNDFVISTVDGREVAASPFTGEG